LFDFVNIRHPPACRPNFLNLFWDGRLGRMCQTTFAMKPKFRMELMVAEDAFLERESRECLPDEQTLAIEFAAKRKFPLEDVRVSYPVVNEIKNVLVSLREKQEINCRQKDWIVYAREWLKQGIEFDLISATEANIADLKLEAYADCFRWSKSKQRYKFRLTQQTGD
jgi:hypothetical protein